MIEASDVSLNSTIICVTSDGTMLRSACGSTPKRIAWAGVSPMGIAASPWPRGTARGRGGELLPAVARGAAAARADDVPRRLLHADHPGLVAHVHDARATVVGDLGDVRDAADEERVDALRGEPRVHLPHLVAEGEPVAPALTAHLDRLHAPLEPRRGRPRAAVSPGRIRSRKWVESRPARKSSCATIWARTGIVVRTPTTLYSPSARAIRAIAASRSAPHTTTLAGRRS